jgi:hypothetical protein
MIIDKQQFRELFETALNEAAENAERILQADVSRDFLIELHLYGVRLCDVDTALDNLYLGEDRAYKVIDVAVLRVEPDNTTVFVRASGHDPVPWEETYQADKLQGPFKQMIYRDLSVAK